jgi:hypothetical protein
MAILPSFFTVKVALAPLPLPFLNALTSIEVETATEQASIFRLNFAMSQTVFGDWDLLQFDLFRPMLPVSISVGLGRLLPETLINGYVREVRVDNQTRPGASTLKVVGLDATATLMNQREAPMPHPNQSDSMIAQTIFLRYPPMTTLVFPTPPSRTELDVTTAQRITDIRFLKGLARRNAYECYVQPDPLLGIDVGHFHPPQLLVPTQGVLSVNFGMATNMDSFDVSYDMLQPTSALAIALDPATKAPVVAPAFAALEPPLGLEPALARILPPPLARPAETDAGNASELVTESQAVVNRSSRALRGGGEIDAMRYGKVLRAGLPVAIRGAGRQYSGNYYVTRVSHSISTDHYTQRFEAWRNAVGLTGAEQFFDPMAALEQ